MRTRLATLMFCVAALLPWGVAWPQAYPAKPIRFIVPFPAGGGADIFARLIGRKLQANELIVGNVAVERRDHPRAIEVRIGIEILCVVPHLVRLVFREPREREPHAGEMLAETR